MKGRIMRGQQTRGPWGALAITFAVAAVQVAAPTAPAHGDEIDEYGKRLVNLRSEVVSLAQGIKRPTAADRATGDRAARRLIEGQVAFGTGNFDDAAVLLYDFVEQYPNNPSFDEGLYYLAESLFQKRDHVASRTYFTRLVTEKGSRSKYFQQSLERLIELSLKLRDSKDVTRWLAALDAVPAGQRRPSVPYVRGKYAFFNDDYDQAAGYFAQVPAGTEYYFQSRYFLGACYTARGELGKAAKEYDQLVKQPTQNNDDRRVVELSHMALGRLYYERDQPSKAIDQYLEIERKSDLFDEALYEVAWVYVKNKQFDKALRALELLALADPSSSKLPEVKILEGNLRIRKARGLAGKVRGNSAEEYTRAQELFEATHDTFRKPYDELKRVSAEQTDAKAFMAQITGRSSETFDVNATLPEIAAAWIREEPEVKRVIDIETDLGDIAAEIDEAERTIERLDRALETPSRVNIFPSLASKRTRATEISEEIFTIRQKMADRLRKLVDRQASAAERAELDRLQAQRRSVAKAIADLPDAEVAYGKRIERARNAFVALDQRAAEVATIIDATRATLVALDKYVKDQVAAGKKPPNLEETRKTVATLQAEIEAMTREMDDLRRQAVLAKDVAGTGDEAALQARSLRARLRTALSQEQQALARVVARLQGGDRAKGNQIATLVRTANTISLDLDAMENAIDEIVEVALAEVREALAEEKARLAAYKREFVTYEAESRVLGGVILESSFGEVKRKFYDVLVRSDIGVIDVTWSQKEVVDEEAQRLNLDRLREARTLREEFRDILEGDDGSGGAGQSDPGAGNSGGGDSGGDDNPPGDQGGDDQGGEQ